MRANRKKETTHSEKGFTLVEILIAMTIFAIGILAVASMQVWGLRGNSSAIWHSQAATWAADRIEKLMTVDYADLADGSETQDDYTITWTVATNKPIDNTATITVDVEWIDRGQTKTASFTCYKADL